MLDGHSYVHVVISGNISDLPYNLSCGKIWFPNNYFGIPLERDPEFFSGRAHISCSLARHSSLALSMFV